MSKRDDEGEDTSLPAPPPRKKRVVKSTLIDHSYIDYSTYGIMNTDISNKGHCSMDNFPQKLHHILSRPEYHHIISWMPHGRAWKIWNRELLVRVVCKEQFKHEKFESFNRQVNGWGFKRLFRNGPDYKCYYNQFFLRGLPDLTSHMHRLDKPGKRIPNKLEEPDLYEISRRFPLPEINASNMTEYPSQNESSMQFDSISLRVPYTYRSSSEQRLHQTLRFDHNECSSSYDALYAPSHASAAPELVSRRSSENKASRWQTLSQNEYYSLQGGSSPCFPVRRDQRVRQEMELSLANNTSFSHQTSDVINKPSNSVGYDEDYKRHWEFSVHTEAPRSYNMPTDAEERKTITPQQHCMLRSHHYINQPINCENTPFYNSFGQDYSAQTHEMGSKQSSYSCATEDGYIHSGQQQYKDWYPTQQQQQQKQYCIQHNHGHRSRQYSYALEHKGNDLKMHYAQPYHQSDSHPCATGQGREAHSKKSQYRHQVQYGYEDRYQAQSQYVQDAQGLAAYNEPINPHFYKSNENYARNSQDLDPPQHEPLGFETHHQWQAQHARDHTKQSGSGPHQSGNRRLSGSDKSFHSRNTDDRTQHTHERTQHDLHSLSPLSSLIDSYEYEPSPSMFNKK